MKRNITAIAKNGTVDMSITVSVKLTGFYKDGRARKIDEIKDDLYKFLSDKYHYSEIKIQ